VASIDIDARKQALDEAEAVAASQPEVVIDGGLIG